MVLDTREEELGWRNKRREREIEWKEKGGKGLQLKGKSERGELHAERKIKKERKKGGKDRKTCTHAHTSAYRVYTRKFRCWDEERERERALQTATGARVFVPPPVIMKKLRLSRPLYVRVHTYTGAGVECANARERARGRRVRACNRVHNFFPLRNQISSN